MGLFKTYNACYLTSQKIPVAVNNKAFLNIKAVESFLLLNQS
jgi:hypothetical protein